MPDKCLDISDADFAVQNMDELAYAATRALEERAAAARAHDEERPSKGVRPPGDPELALQKAGGRDSDSGQQRDSLKEVMRPFLAGLTAANRASGENSQVLARLEKAAAEASAAHQRMPDLVSELQAITEQRNSVSREMFDALHEELRTYKDGFLLDTVHRPMIRDLITLYDDLTEIHRQMSVAVEDLDRLSRETGANAGSLDKIKSIEVHIAHNVEFVIEVLARLEVTRMPTGAGKLDKLMQRAVTVEAAEAPEADMDLTRVFKRGFIWKERVVRPEEVGIKKWKEGFLVAMPQESEKK